jgi:hypothetical protein
VTAHLVQTPGEADRTVFLIKFSEEVLQFCVYYFYDRSSLIIIYMILVCHIISYRR